MPQPFITYNPWTYDHGGRDFRRWRPSSVAFSGQKSSLYGGCRDWHKEGRKPRCLRRLRPETKRPAAVVDFAGLLKWGGGGQTADFQKNYVLRTDALRRERVFTLKIRESSGCPFLPEHADLPCFRKGRHAGKVRVRHYLLTPFLE